MAEPTATMATTTEPQAANVPAWRPGRRLVLAVIAVLLLTALVVALVPDEDDYRVDPTTPQARRAIAVAQSVVPGRLVEVTRDRDNGKWEIIIDQRNREYEVELDARDLSLLRLDYD
jgi:hypothetical protein